VAYWVACSINKGKQNGNNKLCHPQESSRLSFDMFLSLKHISFLRNMVTLRAT